MTRNSSFNNRGPMYPIELIAQLACDEFVALKTGQERKEWAEARGISHRITDKLMRSVRRAAAARSANKRLGLRDPYATPAPENKESK